MIGVSAIAPVAGLAVTTPIVLRFATVCDSEAVDWPDGRESPAARAQRRQNLDVDANLVTEEAPQKVLELLSATLVATHYFRPKPKPYNYRPATSDEQPVALGVAYFVCHLEGDLQSF